MSDAAIMADNHQIVVDEVFPHTLDVVWKTLTAPGMMGRWLKMEPTGFKPTVGTRFTYQTTPAGQWDGVIHCQVLEATPNERLAYSWKGGHEGNVGYGARLDTVVTFVLSAADNGARLRLVHSGFVLPKNQTAFKNMGEGWTKVIQTIDAIAAEQG
ncbi:MAG: ATPase [Caulobacter sp.]|jgi:uncharacterized protein YndB with AHSA1/START domain|nr:ATPase [Caulobacter sp.]